mgnify:FL=1
MWGLKMSFQYASYLIPLFISAFITFLLSIYSYKYRNVKGAKAFFLSMLTGALWALANGLEMAGVDLETKIFWANIQYFFYAFAPLIWLIMVFEFTDREKLLNKKNIFLLSIIPIFTIILVWTNSYHNLMRTNISLDSSGIFSVIVKDYGPWFWVHFVYVYILNVLSILFLVKAIWRRNNIYKKQTLFIFLGYSLIFISNFLYVIGYNPITRFDISPVLFSISGLLMGWGIFRYKIFDVVPIARTTIIDEMASGIVVVNKQKRIIDINPRIKDMFFLNKDNNYLGESLNVISDQLDSIFESISFESNEGFINKELTYEYNNNTYYYEIFMSFIDDSKNNLLAGVMIIHDITDLKKAREKITKQQKELAVMNERQRMARDLHDNLGQVLSFSTVQIQAARKQLKKENTTLADQYLKKLKKIIKDAHKDIREYVYNVRSKSNYSKDFMSLLKNEIKHFQQKSDIEIDHNNYLNNNDEVLNISGIEEKIQLINIVKEALTNVLKHGEASKVNIISKDYNDGFKLIIEDDGKGIENLNDNIGSGLNIMNERARLIGGTLNIESQPGAGCKIIVELPIGGE